MVQLSKIMLLILLVAGLGLLALDSSIGHRFVADQIGRLTPNNGLRYSVGRIDGSLFSDAIITDLRIRDAKGLVFTAPSVKLSWEPTSWLWNELAINRLVLPTARWIRLPETIKPVEGQPLLPGFDVRVGLLRIDRLTVGRAIVGTNRVGRVIGHAEINDGRSVVDLNAILNGSDRLQLKLDAQPDRDRFDIALRAQGAAGGVFAKLLGLPRALDVTVSGDGRWSAWQGRARATVGGDQIIDLMLGNRSGRYTVNGSIMPASLLDRGLAQLVGSRIAVQGAATLIDRKIDGLLSLRSAALSLETEGGVDLVQSAYRNLRLRLRLLQPAALLPGMTGRNVELRAILDGPLAAAAFDYRVSAERMGFGAQGFESVKAAGKGRLSKRPIIIPLKLTVERVTGVDSVTGSILRNLTLTGPIRLDGSLITAVNLPFRSDKLNGTLNLLIDLRSGRYDVGLNGGLSRYLIPGLGIVDVTSRLQIIPGPNGRGVRIVGTGGAGVIRLDNEFFRTLAGGLPRITTNLEQTSDGILRFTNFALMAPDIRLGGNGMRLRDGTFVFEGVGQQDRYGPFTIKLRGGIERPRLEIVFARPNDAAGLRNVRVLLEPNRSGYLLTTNGQSTLGRFQGNGQLNLLARADPTLEIATLDVGGIVARGLLQFGSAGVEGNLILAGRGINGNIGLQPVNGVQRVEARLDAINARLLDTATLRKGHLELVAMLDPDGVTINGKASGTGLQRGVFSLARFSGTVALRDGRGKVEATLSGSRGRAFDIRTSADVTPDSISVLAQGLVDRRPIKLLTPALITRADNGWSLAPTKLSFAGGNAEIGGRFSDTATAFDATLDRLPMSIIDIAYPGLGLAGTASGRMRYAQAGAAAPTGTIDMTVRGLSRSGLLLSSGSIDVGVAAVLRTDGAALRAVMASAGKTIGRAQARLSPLGSGDLVDRLNTAGLFAQVRYNGPADTLWRLTGIDLFDLSGPVEIAADVRGRVDEPKISGVVRAEAARIESATTGTVLTNVSTAGRFTGSRLAIARFSADAGKGGRVTGSGDIDFAQARGFGIDLNLRAENAVLINRDDIGATVTGPLSFKATGAGGVITGDVKLVRSRYRLGQAAATLALPRLNIREINLPGDDAVADSDADMPWQLNLRARADDGLAVTGLGLDSFWSADLNLSGNVDNPAITGRADIIRGAYEFSGRSFAIDRGAIRFLGDTPVNPSLDITANADTTGLTASIKVTGQASKPDISFTSVPALPQDELLSRLLFGAGITSLSAPEAVQLAAAVASMQGRGDGLNPINALRRVAGLDRLRILAPDQQAGRTTSFAAGKYITRRLYAEIVTDGAGYSATRVEFQVTRWLSILSTISTIGRQSVNVRVSRDY